MNKLRFLLFLLLLCLPQNSQAAPDPNTIYTAALASAAAYDDKLSRFALVRLERQGWEIRRFAQQTELADSQFMLAKVKQSDGGVSRTVYILAFRGTEKHLKDIITDFAAELIFFYPSPTRLVAVTYNNKELSADVLVHRGFQAYAETALSVPAESQGTQPLIEKLKTDRTSSVIITGHSLGGAAATLYGAMLLERGVPAERMQVISFGAPPVANIGFSQRYSERLSLLRVVNPCDLVAHLTGPVPDGAKRRPDYSELLTYVHFGSILMNPVSIQDELRQHPMRIYIDYAARASLGQANANAVQTHSTASIAIVNKAEFSGGHTPYMTQAVRDVFAQLLRSHGIAVSKQEHDDTADYQLSVRIDGQQLRSSDEGNVCVSVVARRRSDDSVVWAASRHVSLQEEMSPFAGAVMAADALSSQFPAESWHVSKEIPIFSPLKI